ncbi:prolyl oligopeptidase family serine peptidase [Pontiellaceae bacterium B12227]|nr:prolyl oligopeptidase family serine peptidase [Pontiellaceae bacterium B12227]
MKRILLISLLFAAATGFSAGLETRSWTVDGVQREALVHLPKSKTPVPLVFVFHGHGGNMRNAARSFSLHKHWPEAAVVYMQGLPTPGQLTDPEGKKNGWNSKPTDTANRDLKFFDAVYASLRANVDTNRVFCTGHSNGGGFTYCLWAARGNLFAAVAPSAAVAGRSAGMLKPKPALHLAGQSDALVKYAWQERMMKYVKKVNGCSVTGKPWHSSGELKGTLYPSETGTPLITLISPGGHKFPKEAPALIVEFFQTHKSKQPDS